MGKASQWAAQKAQEKGILEKPEISGPQNRRNEEPRDGLDIRVSTACDGPFPSRPSLGKMPFDHFSPLPQKIGLAADLQNRRDAFHGESFAIPRFPLEQIPVQVEDFVYRADRQPVEEKAVRRELGNSERRRQFGRVERSRLHQA